jgi:competence protein ComGC
MRNRDACTHSRCAGGYTLVELLVVMGIIVLLAGLMLPAVNDATVAYHEFRTRSIIDNLAVGLTHYHEDWGEFPPSSHDDAQRSLSSRYPAGGFSSIETGRSSAILNYCLVGPRGLGWRGEGPYGDAAAAETFGPYYESEEGGNLITDAFKPSKPIFYFRADPYGDPIYHVADQGNLDNQAPPEEGFASQAHFERLAQVQDSNLPESQRWHHSNYLLISPGADRLYGYVLRNDASGLWEAVSNQNDEAFCDDICNFVYRD